MNTVLNAMDHVPAVWEPKVGTWRIWPFVKIMLLWRLVAVHPAVCYQETQASIFSKLYKRLSRYPAAVSLYLEQNRLGMLDTKGPVAILSVPRFYAYPDGQKREGAFDDLIEGSHFPGEPLVLTYPWQYGEQGLDAVHPAHYNVAPYLLASDPLAVMFGISSHVNKMANFFADILCGKGFPLDREDVRSRAWLAISIFKARILLFRHLFARANCHTLLVTHAPGKMAEIAAARECGLKVIEIQHGMFGNETADYVWPEAARAFRAEMPLPDKIGVFGPIFKSSLMENGYWHEEDLAVIGNAAINRYRHFASTAPKHMGKRILFMTQPTTANVAPRFLRQMMALLRDHPRGPFELQIRIHPGEMGNQALYQSLNNTLGDACRILPQAMSPLEAMTQVDAVISYDSMSLAEAVGLGKISTSICGGSTPVGFAGTFNIPAIQTVMPHITEPEEFITKVLPMLEHDAANKSIREFSTQLFQEGDFCANVERLIQSTFDEA